MPSKETPETPGTCPRKSGGWNEPPFRGQFVGQCVTKDRKRPNGKIIPLTINGDRVWYQVKELRNEHVWVWDGSTWLTGSEWHARDAGKKPADRPLVSKRDFGYGGSKLPAWRQRLKDRIDRQSRKNRSGRTITDFNLHDRE